MADGRILDITEDTTPDATDVIYASDTAGTTDKRVQLANLPVSTPVQVALAALSDTYLAIPGGTKSAGKVPLATGSGASAHDWTALAKGDVGLGNVDNTSDANKPVSTAQQTALDLKANLASPALTGHPTGVTESAGDNSTRLATTAYADAKVSDTAYAGSWDAVTGIAPSKNAVYDQMELKAPLASPTLTGTPAAPTAATGTNTTQVATTAYVKAEIPLVAAPLTPTVGTSLGTTGTVDLDMAALNGTIQWITATGNITFTTSNRAAGRNVRIFVDAGASGRTLTYPSWTAHGAALDTSLASGKRMAISILSLGTTDANISAVTSEQP